MEVKNQSTAHYHVKFFFTSSLDLYHASHVLTGLCELAQRKIICFETKYDPTAVPDSPTNDLTLYLHVTRATDNRTLRAAIDLRDHGDFFSTDAFRECDWYLKRSFYRPALEALPREDREKILPFGLNFACSSFATKRWAFSPLFREYSRLLSASPISALKEVKRHVQKYRALINGPTTQSFEQPPEINPETKVIFQTRVWPPNELSQFPKNINEMRVNLVRALRKAFGERFLGGLVPTEFAQRTYPDLLASLPCRQHSYLGASKRALVGIYTHGLHYSSAFKLAEYLAASQCIVAEPPRNELPKALRSEVNYLPFSTVDECIENVERIFNDRNRGLHMRRENYIYYRTEVEPAAHLLASFARMFKLSCHL